MSDTPRTDQVYWYDSEAECDVVSAEFARQLEGEWLSLAGSLARVQHERDIWREDALVSKAEAASLRKEIAELEARLEESIDETHRALDRIIELTQGD